MALNPRLVNICILGGNFFLLFLAFNGVQVLMTTQSKTLGAQTLMTLYAVLAFSNFFTPLVVDKLGHKWSLFVGGLSYVLFIGANIKPMAALLFPASVVLGAGAALLWSAQGGFVARVAPKADLGFYSGIFFMLFMGNLVAGNLISGSLLTSNVPYWVLFVVFMAIGAAGVASMLLLRPLPVADGPVKPPPQLKELLLCTLRLFLSRNMLLLFPLMAFSGATQGYFNGQFPAVIGAYNPSTIGFSMAAFGGAEMLGSILSGRMSDYTGRLPLILAMAIVHGSGLIVSAFASGERPFMFYIATTLMGLGDSILNTQMYAVLGFLFPDIQEAAYAMFKLMQALLTAAAFLYGQYATIQLTVIGLLACLLLGVVCFVLLACITPVEERNKPKTPDEETEVEAEKTPLVSSTAINSDQTSS